MRRTIGFAFLTLLLACGTSRSLDTMTASDLVARYLQPYQITGLTMDSLTRTQSPFPDGYLAVATFTLLFEDGRKVAFKDQPVYITFNEVHHAFEVNRQFTTVAQSVEGAIGIHNAGKYFKSHPYNPSPWNKR